MSIEEKVLQCRDCGEDFAFTVGEQEFYEEKGFTNEPGRCVDCRTKRRQQRSGPREMHDAVCAGCGVETQVPFKPTNGRPVYCSDCFSKQ